MSSRNLRGFTANYTNTSAGAWSKQNLLSLIFPVPLALW